jgi:hypothetical protein
MAWGGGFSFVVFQDSDIFFFFETGSHCVAQAGLKLSILLYQLPKGWVGL